MRIKRTLGVIAAATLIMVTGCGNAVDENVEKENTPAQESSVPVEPTESASDEQLGLTAKEVNGSVSFEEAEVTLVCKKLFKQCLEKENMVPEVAKQFYDGDALHDMYIGEVVDILK